MQSPAAPPNRDTGLPPGVEVGPLGARFVAYLIDSLVPAIATSVLSYLLADPTGGSPTALSVVTGLIGIGWAILLLFLIATRAASPGMRVMKLQLVGFYDGRPIGIVRAFLRGLVFWALSVTGIGLVIMLVLMVIHPRRQGWHDRLAEAVMIKARELAPPAPKSSTPGAVAAQPPAPAYSGQPSQPQHDPQAYAPQQYAAQDYGAQEYGAQQYGSGRYSPPEGDSQRYGPPAPSAIPTAGPPPLAPPAGASPLYAPSAEVAPAPQPPVGATAVHPAGAPQHSDDQTRLHSLRAGWAAVLDDDRRIPIEGLVLLGRNPSPQPGEEDAQLIKLADETRTVSKSHLAIGLDAAGIYVVDRGSTNGSTVTEVGGESTRCRVGEPVYVGPDAIVSMGDHWLRIARTGD